MITLWNSEFIFLGGQQLLVTFAATPGTAVLLINPGADGGMRPQLRGGING